MSESESKFKIWMEQDFTVLTSIIFGALLALVIIVKKIKSDERLEQQIHHHHNRKAQQRLKVTPVEKVMMYKDTMELIQNRRSIMPKDYLPAEAHPVSMEEIDKLLEAANWAPTHGKTEPWRFVVMSGPKAITDYLKFLEDWYVHNAHKLSEESMTKFKNKLEGVMKEWPDKVSHLILIVMKRQALKEKLMPEWEELCAVAMAVQNIHLMATAMTLGMFWSSHTWCKDARDSQEMKKEFNFDNEDKILGALTVGRYDMSKKFTSTRNPVELKVQYKS